MDTVEETVLRIIAERRGMDVADLSLDSTFEELGIDSLAALNLAFEIETEFALDVPDEDVFALKTVRDVVEGIRNLLAGAEPGSA